MDEGEARTLLEDCLRVMFYRDCRYSTVRCSTIECNRAAQDNEVQYKRAQCSTIK